MVATWTFRCRARKSATSWSDMRISSRREGMPLPRTARSLSTQAGLRPGAGPDRLLRASARGLWLRSPAPCDLEQLGYAGLDSLAEDLDVRYRVIVDRHSKVELAGVGEDHDPDPCITTDGSVGIAVEQLLAKRVQGLLRAGHVAGQRLDQTLRHTGGQTAREGQPQRRRKPRHLRQLPRCHGLLRLLQPDGLPADLLEPLDRILDADGKLREDARELVARRVAPLLAAD